ncbi:conserved hypothetical protein [Tenacibaculum sp. 190524A05c]|uniref:hypothetical protein n=1 Tax=Tenacibaculum platacis TaxID=3137852 RepID=UPI0031FB3944
MKSYERIISIESVTYNIRFLQIFYAIKYGAFFFKLFSVLIPILIVNSIASIAFGFYIAYSYINITYKFYDSKYVKESVSVLDFLVLCVITDLLNQDKWQSYVYLILFNTCVAYFSYLITNGFVLSVRQEKEEELNNSKETVKELEEKAKKLKENVKELEEDERNQKERVDEIIEVLKPIVRLTCSGCGETFKNIQAKNRHSCSGKNKDNGLLEAYENIQKILNN